MQTDKMLHFGATLADIVMQGLDIVEAGSTLELNFLIWNMKYTIRRVRN